MKAGNGQCQISSFDILTTVSPIEGRYFFIHTNTRRSAKEDNWEK